jgi:hypothetical protein
MTDDYRRRHWRLGFKRPARRLFWLSPRAITARRCIRTGRYDMISYLWLMATEDARDD